MAVHDSRVSDSNVVGAMLEVLRKFLAGNLSVKRSHKEAVTVVVWVALRLVLPVARALEQCSLYL